MRKLAAQVGDGGTLRSDIIELTLRIAVPLQREFGRSINMTQMLNDSVYARSVVELASSSSSAQLRIYAKYLEAMVLGPRYHLQKRGADPAPVRHELIDAEADQAGAQQCRAQVLGKYRTGLR